MLANMVDVPFNLELQWYLSWQCLQAGVGSGSSGMRLKSSQMEEVLLLPLILGLRSRGVQRLVVE